MKQGETTILPLSYPKDAVLFSFQLFFRGREEIGPAARGRCGQRRGRLRAAGTRRAAARGHGGARPLLAARRAGQVALQASGAGAWAAGTESSDAVVWGRAALLVARHGGLGGQRGPA